MVNGNACFAYFNKIWGILRHLAGLLRTSSKSAVTFVARPAYRSQASDSDSAADSAEW